MAIAVLASYFDKDQGTEKHEASIWALNEERNPITRLQGLGRWSTITYGDERVFLLADGK